MQFINYFFASIISFSGLLIGIALVKIAPEEQTPLKKYLALARKIFLLMIFVFLLLYYFNKINYASLIILILTLLIFVEYKINGLLKKSSIDYSAFGILFFLSSTNQNLFVIESSLILLYGIVTASLLYDKKEKSHKFMIYNSAFVLIANVLFAFTIFRS